MGFWSGCKLKTEPKCCPKEELKDELNYQSKIDCHVASGFSQWQIMLSKDKRLNLKKDFKWVASGKKIDTKFLKLFVRVGENKVARLGITSPSSVFKKAVDRNRARRLTAQAFQEIYSKLLGTINIIALPKQGILDVKSSDVLLDLETTLINEKIIS